MDNKQETNSGVAFKADEAPPSFCVAARAENPSQPGPPTMAATPPVSMAGKKRGRPRKYGSDGSVAAALCPMPISASIPLSGDFTGWKQPKSRPYHSVKKAQKVQFESIGDQLPYSVGTNFTAHVLTVAAGEDVAMKILSFSQQQESRAICVLAASGPIANVTLRQPNTSGGTLTYQGRFEILSLTGSFMPSDNGIVKSRSGGMSVSLAGPDGRVLGGGLAGLLIAAAPVQVVLGSFYPANHQEQKLKKPRMEPVTPVIPAIVTPLPESGYAEQKLNFTSPTISFHTDHNLPPINSNQDSKDHVETDNNLSISEGESDDDNDDDDDHDDHDDDEDSPSNMEIFG